MIIPPLGSNRWGQICRKGLIFKNLLLYFHTHGEKTKYIVTLYQNCEIHAPWVRGQALGWGYYGNIVKVY